MNSHNGELLGAYGNFINRSLTFIAKYFDGIVPEGVLNSEIDRRLDALYTSVGTKIEGGAFKDAIDEIFEFVRFSNKFFDTEQPWTTRTTDSAACGNTLYQCVQIIANLAVLLTPFLPFSSEKVCGWLGINSKWVKQSVVAGYELPEVEILFQRIDKKVIEEETEKLKQIGI